MVRVAAAQLASPLLDSPAAARKVVGAVGEAGEMGVELIAFSEGFIGGHPDWLYFMAGSSLEAIELGRRLIKTAIVEDGPEVAAICDAAARAKVAVVVGAALKDWPGSTAVYNAQLFFHPTGRLDHIHRKLVPTTTERLVHSPGDAAGLYGMQTPLGTVTGLVCGENSNPLAKFVCVAEHPSVHVASWSTFFSTSSPPMPEVTSVASRAMAYEAGCYVISVVNIWTSETVEKLGLGADALRHATSTAMVGGSAVFGPMGETVAKATPGAVEQLLVADVELDAIIRRRMVHDFAGHYNRPDVFQLNVDRTRRSIVHFSGSDQRPTSVSDRADGE